MLQITITETQLYSVGEIRLAIDSPAECATKASVYESDTISWL